MQNYLSFAAAILYIFSLLRPLQSYASWVSLAAWLIHGWALSLSLFDAGGLRVGFALMLSAALWISVLVCWLEGRSYQLEGLRLFLLPHAALMTILPCFFPGSLIALAGKPVMFPWHVIIALLAYGTLTIAAFHAVVMSWQDRLLHQRQLRHSWMSQLLDQLPALLTMEKILFRFILIGFILLSLTVVSGVIFSEQVLGIALKWWDHKTVFSLFSWVLFAVLLAGRYWRGWRGKTVLRFTLSGFVTLLLAYVGTRFVLEVILHRSLI